MAIVNQHFTDSDGTYVVRADFESVEDLAKYAEQFIYERYPNGMRTQLGDSDFYGPNCPTPGTAFAMARDGWDAHLDETLDLARETVETVEAETELMAFTPQWDVTGAMVDVGEYLAGVPECMIEIPPAPTTKYGRVVTMCASASYSCGVNAERLIERGKVITALAIELSRLGISLELYADMSASADGQYRSRILVKGANDILDPAKILFAFAHPGLLRVLSLTAMHGMSPGDRKRMHVGGGYGCPTPPKEDLPEGTIYLPEVKSWGDVPKAADELKRYLRELGLVVESESA